MGHFFNFSSYSLVWFPLPKTNKNVFVLKQKMVLAWYRISAVWNLTRTPWLIFGHCFFNLSFRSLFIIFMYSNKINLKSQNKNRYRVKRKFFFVTSHPFICYYFACTYTFSEWLCMGRKHLFSIRLLFFCHWLPHKGIRAIDVN